MGMFSDLLHKIFSHAAPVAGAATPAPVPTPAPAAAPEAEDEETTADEASSEDVTSDEDAEEQATVDQDQEAEDKEEEEAEEQPEEEAEEQPAPAVVDVTSVLNGLAAKSHEHLDWKKSIVDLLKLVGMDSSFTARQTLANSNPLSK